MKTNELKMQAIDAHRVFGSEAYDEVVSRGKIHHTVYHCSNI